MGCTAGHHLPLETLLESSGLGASEPLNPTLIVAASATALSNAMSETLSLGVSVPESRTGTCLGACLGRQSSGGHSISIESAQLNGSQVVIHVAVRAPSADDVALQAFTSPFAVAVIPGLDPRGRTFHVSNDLQWQLIEAAEQPE